MKTLIRTLLIFMVLAGLSVSCSSVLSEKKQPSQPPVNIPTNLIPIARLTPAFTSVAKSQFDFSCWPIKPLQKGNDISGSFVYAQFDSSDRTKISGIFAWNVSSFHSMTPSIDSSQLKLLRGGSYVSPDGKFIAMLSGKNLLLISQNSIRSFPLLNEDVSIEAYLSDERIRLAAVNLHQERKDHYKVGVGLTDTYYIIDLVTGDTTKHTLFLPNFEMGKRETMVIQYNPDMKYVLYRSTSGINASNFLDVKFTLFDIEKNEVVWVGPSRDANLTNAADSVPGWQPNSTLLTALYFNSNIPVGNNYYSISLDGKVLPFTNFDGINLDSTTQPFPSSWSNFAQSPNWSPNGRYLVSAGSQKGDKSLDSFMFVWDNQGKVGYKPCLPNEEKRIFPHNIYWSFDGSYFMVTLTFAQLAPSVGVASPGYISKNYILDLENKIIYALPDENISDGFVNFYKGGGNGFLGWVRWDTP